MGIVPIDCLRSIRFRVAATIIQGIYVSFGSMAHVHINLLIALDPTFLKDIKDCHHVDWFKLYLAREWASDCFFNR